MLCFKEHSFSYTQLPDLLWGKHDCHSTPGVNLIKVQITALLQCGTVQYSTFPYNNLFPPTELRTNVSLNMLQSCPLVAEARKECIKAPRTQVLAVWFTSTKGVMGYSTGVQLRYATEHTFLHKQSQHQYKLRFTVIVLFKIFFILVVGYLSFWKVFLWRRMFIVSCMPHWAGESEYYCNASVSLFYCIVCCHNGRGF